MSVGLTKLSTAIGAKFAILVEIFASLFPKRLAYGAALVAISVGLLAAFYIALKLTVVGLTRTVPNEMFLMGFYALWPDNAELCLSAYFTARVVKFVYVAHRDNLQLLLF